MADGPIVQPGLDDLAGEAVDHVAGTATPKWRRAEGQRMSPYNLRGNTAQMDEKAVKLVCAAALAGAPAGRCCWSSTTWGATSASSTAPRPSRCSSGSAGTGTSP